MSKVGAQDLIEYLKTDNDLKTKIYNDVVNYFNEQVEQNLNQLSEAEYISSDLYNKLAMFNLSDNDATETLIKAYTYNSWIQNFETVMIFLGDPAEVNHDKEEEHKRNTMAQSNGSGFRTDQGARNFINGYAKKTSYAETLDEKYRVFNFDGTFDTAIVEDVKRTSVYIDIFKEKLTEYYTKKLSKSTLKNKEQIIKEKVENDLDKYTNMEEGDGQGYITFDAYRTLKILENDWDWVEQEKLFQKIVKGETVDTDSIVKFFSPYKIQNYGRLANPNLILPVTAGHKFEVVPLIPSVIKGSDWESLHLQMLAANKQYITYSTGSKVGSITSEVNEDGVAVADEIYEPGTNKKVLKKDIKFTSNRVYLETVKKVTNVAVEYKKKGIFPTQMRVLVLDGMFEDGELINPDDAPFVENYVNAVSNVSNIIEKELLNDIGYTFKDGKISGDLTRFMKVVQRELERKDLPQHLIKFIGVNPDNTLKIDLSLHPNADEIEKILTNLVEKPLIKQKVKGEGLLQVASSMTNGIWDKGLKKETVEDVLKFIGTNNLPFYHPGPDGKTRAMKIAIALQGDFANLLNLEYKGERIATRERLNIAIKDDEWLDANDKRNRQAITLSGVRIPTDSKSQMEFAEVYEFLDPAAGNIVILPTEMVGKTGGDYDGDKLTTQMPHISKKGNFIRRKWSEKELNAKVDELKAAGKNKEAAAIIKLHKKVVENELISSIRGILELSEYYVDLIKPTSTDTLEGIADELQEFVSDYDRFQRAHGEAPRTEIKNGKEVKYISPTNIFEVGYNLHKFQANLDAARPLGITAVENKLSALLNSIGAKMPDKYRFAFYDDPKGRWIETDQIYKMRLLLPHNKVNVNGVDHISIAGIDSVDMENVISVLNTQLLNGFLDVEKKPWPFYIQGNLEIVPMLINLLQVGVPVRDAIYFVSNPMVKEYAKQQRLIKSKYAHLIGKSVTSPAFTQYKAAERTLDKYGPFIKGYVKPNAYITNKTYYGAVTKATGLPNVLNDDGYFDSKILERVVKEEGNPDLMPQQFAMFLHFLELEKEFKGYQALKRQLNPDTKTSKTLQEIIRRDVAFEDLDASSKIDKETKRRAREESLLTSFFDASKTVVDVIKPLFPFRNNDMMTNYIIKALQTRSNQIRYNYKTGREATSKFITDFKNAVTTAMFQKSVGTIYDPNGEPITFERMVSAGPNSYSAMMFDVIEKLPKEVKDKYPVLQQLTPILLKSGQRVLTLNDRKQAKGDLTDIYYQNLKELSNVNVRKVANTERNQYISQMFQMLPLVTVYQNGVGYSAYGFNSSLPYDEIIDVLQAASDDYIKNNMTEAEFTKIINKLAPSAPIEGQEETRKKSPFKNYNVSDAEVIPEMSVLNVKFDDIEDTNPSDSELPSEKDIETGEIVAKRTFGAAKEPVAEVPGKFQKKNLLTITPQEGVFDNKAKAKASIATQYIGFGEEIVGKDGKRSSTQLYREQAGTLANTGNYSSDDVIFVSIPGLRGDATVVKREQDKTIKEAIKALEAGATILTDNKSYIESSKYNTGEQRLYKNLEAKGYNYSEITVDGQVIGTWSKTSTQPFTQQPAGVEVVSRYTIDDVKANPDKIYIFGDNITEKGKGGQAIIRDEENAFGIPTKVSPDTTPGAYFSDKKYDPNIRQIDRAIEKIKADGRIVVLPKDGLGTGLAKLKEKAPDTYAYLKQRLLEEFGFDNDTGKLISTQPSAQSTEAPVSNINKPKGKEVVPGIYVNQAALTKEEQLELFDYLKPYLEEQAAKTLKASNASKMIGLGLRWDYKSNNVGRTAVNIPDVINPGNKNKYGYYDVSINDQPLGQISPRFRELMQKATGVDMTNYDGAIINLYEKDTFISSHNDVDESRSAIKYPVIGINLGGKGNFSIERIPGAGQLNLEAGTGYIFGVDGVNREVWHRTFPTPQNTFLPELTTKIDGKTYPAGSYRITITMRRVMPLEPGMPTAPAKITTEPTVQPTEVKSVSVKLINDEDIARFKSYIEKAGGLKPKEFFTASTKFSAFYNSASGRKEGAPQESKWLLNIDGTYDLVDQITGEIYLTNVDLLTGIQTITKTKAEEIEDKIKDIETQIAKGKLGGAQLAQQIEGKLDANKDQLIALLGQTMYSKNLKDVVYKELLQNAFDATKIAIAEGKIKKGEVDITIDEKERTITFTDNGIGMSPEIVQKAFFTIGGTYKGENVDNKLKSGGLGLAKMAFIFGSERLILKTINNGIETTVDATSQEIRNDNFKINTKSSNQANGTSVTVKIPETYTDAKGEKRDIDFPSYTSSEEKYSFLAKPLIGNIDVKYSIKNRTASYLAQESKKLKLGTIPEGYTLFTNATTDFAEIEIYIDNNKPESKYDIKHQILSSGLYQFDKSFKTGSDKIPLNIIVNIKPTVDTVNPQYPFNNQREDFRPTVDSDITALNHYLATLWKTIELKMLKNSFSKIQNIEAIDINNVDKAVVAKNKELLKSFEAIDEKTIITDTINDFRDLDKDLKITDGGVRSSSRSITKEEIKKEEEKGYRASFRAKKEVKIDKSFETGLNPNKPIVHNNTNMQLSETDVKFLSEVSSVLLEYKKSIMKFYGEDYSDNIKTQLWGVSIDKTYGGVNVNPDFVNMLAINPFYHLPENLNVDTVNYLAVAIDHLIIHELNHNFERNEGAGFTGRFLQTYAEIQSLPNHFELFSNLKLVIKNNLQTIKKLNNEYRSADNVESGFEGNKLQQGDQERTDRGYETIPTDDTEINEGSEEIVSGSNNEFGEIIRAAVSKKESAAFKKQKNAAIKSILDGVKDYRLDEIMAVNGYDYKDIISNLEAATTEDEFNKIINKILKYLC
jgi:alkylated DNA repair dioxygenase AlkB